MIPEPEQTEVILTLAHAEDLARKGSIAAGYALLWRGAERGSTALAKGQPWAEDLLKEWHRALDLYFERFCDGE